jgi:hypothetical protein
MAFLLMVPGFTSGPLAMKGLRRTKPLQNRQFDLTLKLKAGLSGDNLVPGPSLAPHPYSALKQGVGMA